MVRNWRSAGCSTNAGLEEGLDEGRQLPSMPGDFGPLMAISRLSRPRPATADMQCSMVSTASAPLFDGGAAGAVGDMLTRAGLRHGAGEGRCGRRRCRGDGGGLEGERGGGW